MIDELNDRDGLVRAALEQDPPPPPGDGFWADLDSSLEGHAGGGVTSISRPARRWMMPATAVAATLVIAVLALTSISGDPKSAVTTAPPVATETVPDSASQIADSPPATSQPRASAQPTVTLPAPPSSLPTGPVSPAVEVAPRGRYATVKAEVARLRVYDEPGGEPRSLQYTRLDGTTVPFPLINPTYFGSPLVLKVLRGGADDEWLLVQSPSRPKHHSVWIRGDDVEVAQASTEIRADVATGIVEVWDNSEIVFSAQTKIGYPDKATPTGSSWVNDIIPGPNAAYGSFIVSVAAFSEWLNEFSAGLPQMALHGTNTPDLISAAPTVAQLTSGSMDMANRDIEALVALIEPGTPVVMYDSGSEETGYEAVANALMTPAPTIAFDDDAPALRPAFI